MDLRLPSRKKPAPFVGEYIVSTVDMISMLPDEVLCYILSFLSTKEAIQTSILSKRWECLWTSTTNLDVFDHFSNKIAKDNNSFESIFRSFKDYVDRVLFCHGGTTIQRCHFQPAVKNIASNLYTWICLVITCSVEELRVETSSQHAQDLPWRVFTCRTLVALKLQGLLVLNLPTYISLPSLKTLSLAYVVYMDDASMQRLFSSCPSLEDLNVERTGWDGVQIMNISVPSLKRLTLDSKMHYISGYKYKTVMDCPILEYLSIHDTSHDDCSANFSSSLVEARVSGGCTFGLFEGISQVKHLVLYVEALLSLKTSLCDNDELSTLYNLTKLELFVGMYIDWELLPELLESSPNLEALIFPKGLVVPKANGCDFQPFYWYEPEDVAECLVSHLKTIEINNFVGMPGEMYLVEYLLKNSSVLDRMDIRGYDFTGRPRMQKKLELIRDEVLRMTRGSMDFNFPFPKRPTVCFRVNNASGVDRISALPDEVLRHILSFLTMKQAVATSMLSKRWEGLWTSIANLEFNDESPPHGVINYSDYESVFKSFKDFVERILFYHDGREIQKCHFVCCSTIGASNLYAWICAVIASNVQELIDLLPS